MENNPDKAAKYLIELANIFASACRGPKWSILIEEGSLSPIAIGVRQLDHTPKFHDKLFHLGKVLCSAAYPVSFTCINNRMQIRLAGIEVFEPELVDFIEDLQVVQQSVPTSRTDDVEAFNFGYAGKLTPANTQETIFARSPIEAVMKFIITRVPVSEMNAMPLHHPDLDYTSYEMRAQKDWANIPFTDAYYFACKYLTATLVTRSMGRKQPA
jgi:hypothetical protein